MRAEAWWIAALLRLYPRAYRERHAAELASAMNACVRQERERGVYGCLTAARLFLDAVSASVLVRRDIRRSQRMAHLSPKDSLMQSILYDLRYSLRLIARAPLFSVLVIATLALAIGANTAIFSVVNGVLLRALPFESPERLVVLYKDGPGGRTFGFAAPDFVAFRERTRSYQGIAAYGISELELSGVATPERIKAARISASLLDVLGVRPALGRAFTSEEDTGRQPVAILSDALWRRSFAAAPSVIGQPVILDRRAYTIVGVMPAHASFPYRGPRLNNEPAAVFVPISFSDFELRAFGSMYNKTVVARLKTDVTMEQARDEAAEVSRQIGAELYPAELRELGINLKTSITPMQDEIVGDVRRLLYVLLGAVGVVLLIACADIACLMLTRVAGRERELAIRTALGAGRGRVMRLMLMETGLLAAVGTAIGAALAWWGQRALLAAAPVEIPRAQEIAFDVRVLAFTVAVSIAAALITGLLPAWDASRRDSNAGLKEGGRTGTGGARQQRIFAGLVTLQFAGAVVLLAAGGLLMRSFVRLMTVDPGFASDHVVSAATSLPGRSYRTGGDVRLFYSRLLESARALPGVTAVGASTDLPLTVRDRRVFTLENPPAATATLPRVVAIDYVMGQYFEALGVRIVSGRPLSDADALLSEPVVVVNETLARRYWPGEDPIERRLAWGMPANHGPWMRVVGVIGDIKQAGLAAPTEPQIWQPWAQVSDQQLASNIPGIFRSMRLMVRSQVPPASLVSAIRDQVRALDPALPVTDVQTLDDLVAASAAPQRFNAALLGGFAGIALLLAAVGIGGVLAITVSRRTQEFGVRLALGADAAAVVRMVIRQGMTLVAAGLAIGLPIAFASTRLLTSLLFETTAHDVVTFAGATVVLCLVACAACTAPAIRASRVDPMRALRID